MKRFDYSQPGYYAVTICALREAPPLSNVVNGQVQLTPLGEVIQQTWLEIPAHNPGVEIDASVIMPDHFHGILHLTGGRARGPAPTLGEVVKAFKSLTAKRSGLARLWQRNYYERVLRNEAELEHARRYIAGNPLRWAA